MTAKLQATSETPESLADHAGPGASQPGAPRLADARHERTAPLTAAPPRGPDRAQLRALAEGRGGPLILADRFRLERWLGRGGMATIFAGRQLSIGRPVAIKIFDDKHGLRDDGLDRFLAEARILGELRHSNIVEVLDCGSTPEGIIYMVMELLEGEDLRDLLSREGPLEPALAQAAFLDICAGLAAVHARGLVHRDLKPANCFVTAEGFKLLDFGVAAPTAKVSAADRRAWFGHANDPSTMQSGRIVGTPHYMAPEQARGEPVDERADVYAAGILLAQLLTGEVPFNSKSKVAIIDAQLNSPPPTLAELAGERAHPALAGFEAVYARALHKDPGQRYQTVEEFAAAVAAVKTTGSRWWESPRELLRAVARAAALI